MSVARLFSDATNNPEETPTMTTLNHTGATTWLTANPGKSLYFNTQFQGGTYDPQTVWLDDDGDLVQSHPTDLRRGPISAPTDARFRFFTADPAEFAPCHDEEL